MRDTVKLADAIVFSSIRRGKTIKHKLGEVLEEVNQGIGESWADYPVLGATRVGLAPAKKPQGKKPERYKPAFPCTVFYNPMRILIGSIALEGKAIESRINDINLLPQKILAQAFQ